MRVIYRSREGRRRYSGRHWRRRKSHTDLIPIFSRPRGVRKLTSITSSYCSIANNKLGFDPIMMMASADTFTNNCLPDQMTSTDMPFSRSKAQLEVLRSLIKNHPFNLDQLLTIKDAIEDRFVKMDIISAVPYEIALYIMSFLSAKDICQAAQTCWSWRTVCEDNRLWREKCTEDGLLNDEQSLDVLFKKRIVANHENQMNYCRRNFPSPPRQETTTPIERHEWKVAFFKHMNILRNWQTREFKISDSFLAHREQQTQVQPQQQPQPQQNQQQQQSPQQRQLRMQPVARYMQPMELQPLPVPQQQDRQLENLGELIQPQMILRGAARQQRRQALRLQLPYRRSQPDHVQELPSLRQQCPSPSSSPSSDTSSSSLKSITNTPNHLMQLPCHAGYLITCLQYNHITNTIVSGSDDRTLKVWNSETGQCINTLEGHEGGVWSLQLSKDDIITSGSVDRTVKVWNAHTGELMHTLHGHTSTVRCLALDGQQVVSGSRDKTLRIWDYVEGSCIEILTGHNAPVRCVEFKDNIIVSGAYDHLVMVWDANTKSHLHTLEFHRDKIYSMQFDGKVIASGSIDTTICIWDAVKGTLRHQLKGHTSLTSEMKLKGNYLVSANADSYCKVWDITTGECIHTLGGDNRHRSAITSVYANNNHIVTSSDDGSVKLWDFKTGNFIKNLIVLPTASEDGVVWRIRASYTKLICAVGSRGNSKDSHLLVFDFNA